MKRISKPLEERIAESRALCQQALADFAGQPDNRRAQLLRRALEMLDHIAEAPVENSVKHLMCKCAGLVVTVPDSSFSGNWFESQDEIMRGLRFPAGQHQWGISGFPRSWIPKVPLKQLPKVLGFISREAHGFYPYFETHLAPVTQGVSVFLEREFRASFYRMARSLEKQPGVKGIMAVSWMHSPETYRVTPHLAFMNRPFLEAGGLVTDVGPAAVDDGFLEGSAAREKLYHSGEYHPTKGVALCSRRQAIAWAEAHPEAGELARKLI